jgi:hypothetical protein
VIVVCGIVASLAADTGAALASGAAPRPTTVEGEGDSAAEESCAHSDLLGQARPSSQEFVPSGPGPETSNTVTSRNGVSQANAWARGWLPCVL